MDAVPFVISTKGPFFSCAEITGGDISISPKRWLIDVLIFHCSNCNETINSADDESTDQIFARLEEHVVTKCLLATLLSTERRTLPGRELALGDQSLSVSALWVGCGYTDQWA